MTTPHLSIAAHLSLMKAGRQRAELVVVPPPPTPPQPYEVRLREAMGNSVMLIGYDGKCEPFSEWRVPRKKVTARMIERFRNWCRENDEGAELHIVP